MFQKDDMITVRIENLGNDGEGIGKADGYTLFIKDALPGDLVQARIMKAKKQYGYARMMELLEPSPFRVEPPCALHMRCGGCQLQALSYEKQLQYKEDKVRGHLERIGGFQNPPLLPIIGMEEPFHYRNKAQFPFGKNKEGKTVTGFYASRTHSIIPNTDCALGVEENRVILELILQFMEEQGIEPYDEGTGKGLLRHALIRKGFATGELMVCLVLNGRSLPGIEKLADRLFEIPGMTSFTLNVNQKNTNVIMGEEVIPVRGQTYITDKIGEVSYQISPLSFYQVNPVQTRKLYQTALDYAELNGNETVWDLYCGIGTISLFLAREAGQVYGVEIVPDAIRDAKKNAELNGITNATFYVGKAEEVLPEKYSREGIRADVIVVDPPRKGCDEKCLETMVCMAPQRIVYVSCDSATLARDLKYLCQNGYSLQKVQPVDMFAQTAGVENVALLQKDNR
jgi:23S rRNA (uracil1939-C5)-methyltransferase